MKSAAKFPTKSTIKGQPPKPKPSKTLSPEAKKLWKRLQFEYGIDDEGGLLLLQTAFEAYDRMKGAQRLILAEGLTLRDRFGQARAHPAATIERDARSALMAALKHLNLDLEPLANRPGRP
jgi:P27 family predicted phage terminase small subunit